MSINNFLEYYFTKDIVSFLNKIKNTKLQKSIIDVKNKLHSSNKKQILNNLCSICHNFTEKNYNKTIHIDVINEYTVLKFPIKPSESLKQMAKQCLKNILKSQKY